MSNKLYVGNLSFDITENDLRDMMAQHGPVNEVNVIMDKETGRARGFAFVTMNTQGRRHRRHIRLERQGFSRTGPDRQRSPPARRAPSRRPRRLRREKLFQSLNSSAGELSRLRVSVENSPFDFKPQSAPFINMNILIENPKL